MSTIKIETLRKLIDHHCDDLCKSEIDSLHDLLLSEIDENERYNSESSRRRAENMYSIHLEDDTLDIY